jgi:cytochrome b subunit of formate dehydrogenase
MEREKGREIRMEEEKIKELVKETMEKIMKEEGTKIDEKTFTKIFNRAVSDIERSLNYVKVSTRDRIKRLKKDKEKVKKIGEEEYFIRFNIYFRIQHMILFTSVIILILTGLPLKFPDIKISHILISLMGGISHTRIVHRVGASMLIFFIVYHMLYVIFHREGRRDWLMLLPRPKDLFDFFQNILYFLGKTNEKPKFDRFSYIEKFDYWAVYWGCIIMIGSGLLLWFEEISMRFFPKYIIDIAKEAHSDEALLATLAIVVWHFYNVHFNPARFPGTLLWWHGRISKHEMMEEHPLEYERLMKEREKNASS